MYTLWTAPVSNFIDSVINVKTCSKDGELRLFNKILMIFLGLGPLLTTNIILGLMLRRNWLRNFGLGKNRDGLTHCKASKSNFCIKLLPLEQM